MSGFGIEFLSKMQDESPAPDFEAGIYKMPTKAMNPKDLDFESGIFTLDKVKEDMLHDFRHGTPGGETTHIEQIDTHFTWRKGELTAVTGWPQHGKTEGTLFMMLLKAVFAAWRWIVFTPENYPARVFYNNLAHSYMGITVDPKYPRMNEKQYMKAMDFVTTHFIYIYPNELHTPEIIRMYVDYLLKNYGKFDGTLKDPWNKFTHDFVGREDQYLASQFPLEQKVARLNNLCSVITAHPRGYPKISPDGLIEAPDQFDISGGTMWNNMFDNILAWNRPEYKLDKASTRTEFHSHKIKIQKLVGIPGSYECDFNRVSNRYEFDGYDPLVKPGIQTGYQANLVIPDPEPKKLIPLAEAEIQGAPKFDDTPPF